MIEHTVSALINVFGWLVPEIILAGFACVMFLGSTWKACRHTWGAFALVGLGAASIALWLTPLPRFEGRESAWAALYAGPVWLDRLAVLLKAVALVGGAVLVLFTWDDVPEEFAAEFHACLLTIVAGVCLTASANDLVVLFLALELVSIPTYVALYLARSDDPGKEAGVKYFLLSVFSSALLLFGFSYLYGAAGTTNLQGIADALATSASAASAEVEAVPGTALVALVMVVAGLGFRITAVPFHFYAPDVYQGTSTGAAALLAFIPKVAGFGALIRVLGLVPYAVVEAAAEPGTAPRALAHGADPLLYNQLAVLLWIVAAVTMTLGNVLALLQDNVKRMLAYSSVAHAGYMLIGLAVAPYFAASANRDPARDGALSTVGTDAVLFYLVAYGAMTVGAFAILEYLSTRERPVETVDDLAGLSKSHPGVALLMALFMFSLIGIPATAGFIAKLLIFLGAFSLPTPVSGGDLRSEATLFRILVLIGAINAAIGGWYYLRIVATMYLRTPLQPLAKPRVSPRLVAIGVCALVTLVFGLYPKPLVDRSQDALKNRVEVPADAAVGAAAPGPRP